MFREYHVEVQPWFKVHGPCITGEVMDGEFDLAFCLQCPYWPRIASSFITRTLTSGWPSKQVVTDIINDGCLFVPLSNKMLHCQDAHEMEWRMSFSLAEKKLVYSMNHCQFLCYGLLKLFLNEVLKTTEDINDLLCSYFMKTAVFWEISEDKSGWTSQNYLCKFWKTFCRLLNWVHGGYCPNFFNSDHNMFAGKIHGRKQRLLMEALRSFHSEGVLCLLKCPSLNTGLSMLLQVTMISPQLNTTEFISRLLTEESCVPQWYLDFRSVLCILSSPFVPALDLSPAFKIINEIRNVRPTSSVTKPALQYLENGLLLSLGEAILSKLLSTNYRSNKTLTKCLHTALNIFYRNGTTFCASEIVVAKWFYILRMFHNAIHILNIVKSRLQGGQFMYKWTVNEAGFGRLYRPETPYNLFIKSSIASNIFLTVRSNVSELDLELRMDFKVAPQAVLINPIVFVNFLIILCYHHLGETIRRNDVQRELHALVSNDKDYHIPFHTRAISWEILGICQQLCGDYHGAYHSYVNALNDESNWFQRATITRILITLFVCLTNA